MDALAAAADDDDDDGGGGDDYDDDDNDNDDNYDDDDEKWQNHPCGRQALPTTISIKKTLTLLICDHPAPVNRGLPFIVEKKKQKTKTLTDDRSALYWTQELGLTCLESGRRAASNEPSCFSRR